MKVLWITSEFAPKVGGIQTYTTNLTTALSQKIDVGIVVPQGSLNEVAPKCTAVAEINLRYVSNMPSFIQATKSLAEFSRDFKPDLIHFGSAGIAVYRHCLPAGVPVVATVHGKDLSDPWQCVPGDRRETIKAGLAGCNGIFVLSNFTSSFVRSHVQNVPVWRVPPGCDLSRFYVNEKVRDKNLNDDPVMLTVARVIERKGHMELLSGLERAATRPKWVVVGDGPALPRLKSALARSPIGARTKLLGKVSDSELQQLYTSCDVFALTPIEITTNGGSDWEGFGLVYYEASASGKAVIASDMAGPSEAVLDGITGILVTPTNSIAIGKAIDKLFLDDVLRNQLGASGRRHIESIGGWDQVAANVLSVYARLTGLQE